MDVPRAAGEASVLAHLNLVDEDVSSTELDPRRANRVEHHLDAVGHPEAVQVEQLDVLSAAAGIRTTLPGWQIADSAGEVRTRSSELPVDPHLLRAVPRPEHDARLADADTGHRLRLVGRLDLHALPDLGVEHRVHEIERLLGRVVSLGDDAQVDVREHQRGGDEEDEHEPFGEAAGPRRRGRGVRSLLLPHHRGCHSSRTQVCPHRWSCTRPNTGTASSSHATTWSSPPCAGSAGSIKSNRQSSRDVPCQVSGARRIGRRVIDRCYLTVLRVPGQEDTAEFLADHEVEVVASLPC